MSDPVTSPTPFPAAGNISDAEREDLRRHGILMTSLEELHNWGRSNSIWPLQFGLACCATWLLVGLTLLLPPRDGPSLPEPRRPCRDLPA